MTLPVSDQAQASARLLQERREKLAKWKLKKAQFDQQKKKDDRQPDTNKESTKGQSAAVQSKVEAWKRKKRERDQERLKEKTTDEKQPSKNKRSKKQLGSKIAFEESDEETSNVAVPLFKPGSDNVSGNGSTATQRERKRDDELIDPLEAYMKQISGTETSSADLVGDFLETNEDDMELDEEDDGFDQKNEDDTRYARMAKLKSKKKVKELSFSTEDLEPFRKEFYVQSEDLNNMSESEAVELRLAIGNIKVKGDGCPLPVTRWSQLGLTSDVMNFILHDLKYQFPTPIQSQAMPAIMCGRDVIGISRTGSGKTISYLLPLLRQIKAQRSLSENETGPLGLILAPTRELALQIHEEVEIFTKKDPSVNSICCTGGSELKQQINMLKRGTEIVVATPGRFIDLLTLNTGKLLTTKRITFVVLDEADRLFDLGFEPQITQIMKTIRPDKQCVLFSATFPNKLRSFAMRVLRSPLSITINSKTLVNENVKQKFELFASDELKYYALLKILDERMKEEDEGEEPGLADEGKIDDKAIIFVSSQQICDFLATKLTNEGYNINSIHAGKPYQERVANLQNFKNTRNSILLCTEVLSRGLNVPEVSLVIIFNAVKTFAQYVHTAGRTARGTNKGEAVTLLLNDEISAAYILRKALRDPEINNHDAKSVRELYSMSDKFEAGMKDGKLKISQGFGGKGLDNLESKRDMKQKEERKTLGDLQQENGTENKANTIRDEPVSEAESKLQIPKLQYVVSQLSNPDGTVTFSAEINVNDLPQLVRWEATKNTTLMFIKHETGCSITSKGRYYPEGKAPKSQTDEPKLYLLVESQQEKDIRLSIELLEQKVKEGVKKASIQSIKDTKY